MIYFAEKSDGSGVVKIGYTKHHEKRMIELSKKYGALTLLGLVHGYRPEEQEMHNRFRHLRIKGEWFKKTPELMEYIAIHTSMTPPVEPPEREPSKKQVISLLIKRMSDKQMKEGRLINIAVLNKETGISRQTLTGWLNNSKDRFDLNVLETLCNYFGCDVRDMLTIVEAS